MSDTYEIIDDGAGQKGPLITVEDIEALKKQAVAEKAARQAAEDRASRAEREAQEARSSSVTSTDARFAAEEREIDTAMSAWESERAALRRQAASLMAEGKFEEAAEINDKVADVAAEMRLAKQKKEWIADAKKLEAAQREAPRQRQDNGSGVNLDALSAREKAWVKDHPEYMTDARFRNRVTAAHYAAVAEGIPRDSDEYFEVLENYLIPSAPRRPAMRQEVQDEEQEQQPRRQNGNGSVNLPAQRRAPNVPQHDAPVRLTEDEKEAANITYGHYPEDDWVDEKGVLQHGRYRRYKLAQAAMKAQGRI